MLVAAALLSTVQRFLEQLVGPFWLRAPDFVFYLLLHLISVTVALVGGSLVPQSWRSRGTLPVTGTYASSTGISGLISTGRYT